MFGIPQFIQKMVTFGQRFQEAEVERIRLLNDNTSLLRTVTRLERDRDKAKLEADGMKVKLDAAEDNLRQALFEIDSTKKAAYDDGYQKGFDTTTASYVAQMPTIQDQIWGASWEACLTKIGVADDSPFWVENDLPSSRLQPSHNSEEHPEEDVEQQIEEFADADEDTQMETRDVPIDHSPVQEAMNETINLKGNAADGGLNTEVNTEVTTDVLPEVQNLD